MAQQSGSIWRPYTDAALPLELSNIEHIIPLSLAGVNGFTIPVTFTPRSGPVIMSETALPGLAVLS